MSGIPAGKSTFCRWLEEKKGFLHVDVEKPGVLDRYGLATAWDALFDASATAAPFIDALDRFKRPVVIDWGFPPEHLNTVRKLSEGGVMLWWFAQFLGVGLSRAQSPQNAKSAGRQDGWRDTDWFKTHVPDQTHKRPHYIQNVNDLAVHAGLIVHALTRSKFTVSTIRGTTTRSRWAKGNLFICGNTKMARGKSHGSSVMTTTPWQSDGLL